MIKTTQVYVAVCDNCKEVFESREGYGTFPEMNDLEDRLIDHGWHEIEGNNYCKKCILENNKTDASRFNSQKDPFYENSKLFIEQNL
ncbi:hypothetical protein F0919_17985 [Taibaiella lutea]|uniref:Uncharacterized protein n=1 Tax=Taibaiella lutea TaxID=2608001 RepID=A0A5M6CC88_9BACT|nr:hypothetical protein [Taibaiella lutea]KAA5532671.1 hypothetical protein F0919_17985 [Taibaiella lutea]